MGQIHPSPGIPGLKKGPEVHFDPLPVDQNSLVRFSVVFCVRAYVLMYVKRLVFVYVCGRLSYLCVSVKPAIFVYIREPFAFWPTLGEDFGFDVTFLLMYVHGCTQKRTYIRNLGYEVVLAHENHETISFAVNCVWAYVCSLICVHP